MRQQMLQLCRIPTAASSRGTSSASSKVRAHDPDMVMRWRDACRCCALKTSQMTILPAFTGHVSNNTTVIRRGGVSDGGGDKEAAPKDDGGKACPASPAPQSWRVSQTWGEADRRAGVTCMEVVSESVSGVVGMATVLVGRRNGVVDVVRVDRVAGAVDTSSVVRCGGNTERLSTAGAQGDGRSISSVFGLVLPGGVSGGQQDGGDEMMVCVVAREGTVTFYDARMERTVGGFSCPPRVTCAAYHAPSGQLAVGCEGAELRVYTLSWQDQGSADKGERKGSTGIPGDTAVSGTLTYSAKGGKPDKVGFCDKPWNSAVVFNPLVADGSQIIVATGHGKLRLYDTKVGRRPQMNVPFKERRITCVSPDGSEGRWWVTDAEGNFQSYDVSMGKFLGGIRGVSGSIRSTDLHPTAPLIVSGGLDRYIRVHSTRTRAMVMRLYMTSQLCVVKWLGLGVSEEQERTPTAAAKKKKKKKRRRNVSVAPE